MEDFMNRNIFATLVILTGLMSIAAYAGDVVPVGDSAPASRVSLQTNICPKNAADAKAALFYALPEGKVLQIAYASGEVKADGSNGFTMASARDEEIIGLDAADIRLALNDLIYAAGTTFSAELPATCHNGKCSTVQSEMATFLAHHQLIISRQSDPQDCVHVTALAADATLTRDRDLEHAVATNAGVQALTASFNHQVEVFKALEGINKFSQTPGLPTAQLDLHSNAAPANVPSAPAATADAAAAEPASR